MKRCTKSLWLSTVSVVAVAVVVLLMWNLAIILFDLPAILLPTPWRVLEAAFNERVSLFEGTLVTGVAATAGLVSAILLGSALSILFSLSEMIRRALFPYVVFLQTVPIVAIAPLLITWSGYQFRTVVLVTVIICLFPIVNSVTAGLMSIPKDLDDLFRLYGAGRIQRLLRLQLPSAVPDLIVGMKTSSGLAVIGAIVAEFFVGNGSSYIGLGTLMTGWQAFQRTDALIAAIFASTALGLLLFASVNLFAVTILSRWRT
ncbi:putative aliphatic sulfonates transport permease protein SsuC [Novipirellula aureliae]|uniref:Putative aliphatic sulfonates transport permease protein SsuC n=1 Tax=Novipirellula aureliae TaxID=2527966 RepID=A0A5C6E7A9_9BACT|nr:ABC transporter permease subunit [Novipirellula aureliae]TWU43356.1 putative aliphatic sulfonates transport permease protein SsuC [Novipirellula aureliae]